VKGIPQERYVRHGYGATANLGTTRMVLDRVKGFDARRKSGGDADFCRRATGSGSGLEYLPQAIVDHPARATWLELKTKARRVKGGQIRHQNDMRGLLIVLAKSVAQPFIDATRFLLDHKWPLPYRLSAV